MTNAEWLGIAVSLLGSLVGALLGFVAAQRKHSQEHELLHNLARIEQLAASLASGQAEAAERMSIFRLRAELIRNGTWSTDDLKAFDRAYSVRNAFVHLDRTGASAADLEASVKSTARLVGQIEATVLAEAPRQA